MQKAREHLIEALKYSGWSVKERFEALLAGLRQSVIKLDASRRDFRSKRVGAVRKEIKEVLEKYEK